MELDETIENIFRLQLKQKKALDKLGIKKVKDLLLHFPGRYQHGNIHKKIAELEQGDEVILHGKLSGLKTKKAFRKKIPMSEGSLEDDTGKIKILWFHQAFIGRTFKDGALVKIVGRISEGKYGKYISNPEIEKVLEWDDINESSLFARNSDNKSFFYPIYPESRGITSRWFFHAIQKVLSSDALDKLGDPIPEKILKKYNLPSLKSAYLWIHTPKKEADIIVAKKRFSFQEIFFIQISRLKNKKEYEENPAFQTTVTNKEISSFLKKFPFKLTNAQDHALGVIVSDLRKKVPMSRLLEGDVGSGKTAVAAAAAYSVINTSPDGKDFGNLQCAYMVPTEILARQQFESFIQNFIGSGIQVGLITGSECRKFPSKIDPSTHTHISRPQLMRWIEDGSIPILVGTHALIQEKVKFKHLAFVIIDEQHRFGVMQRAKLARKNGVGGRVPHLLSMTATPIPRTLALTIYGDLDLTLIDEMPKGRKQIITEIVPPNKRDTTYEKIKIFLKEGRQVFIICPRIEEPDPEKESALRVKSAKAEAKRLQDKIFTDYNVGLVHSKLKPKEKEEVMNDFAEGKINILTATSVVEVGVNVPNATLIVIEGAERFGLAQLHQLRGRVLRSEHQAYCFLFSDSKTKRSLERLKALEKAKNGFELAELDLGMRGEGALSGGKQWGLSDVGMEGIKNIKMVEAAREEAKKIIEKDKELKKHPLIKERVSLEKTQVHFE